MCAPPGGVRTAASARCKSAQQKASTSGLTVYPAPFGVIHPQSDPRNDYEFVYKATLKRRLRHREGNFLPRVTEHVSVRNGNRIPESGVGACAHVM